MASSLNQSSVRAEEIQAIAQELKLILESLVQLNDEQKSLKQIIGLLIVRVEKCEAEIKKLETPWMDIAGGREPPVL